jgi:sugar phosphate permease
MVVFLDRERLEPALVDVAASRAVPVRVPPVRMRQRQPAAARFGRPIAVTYQNVPTASITVPDTFSAPETSLPLITIFLVADVGGILGGWFSSALIRRGWSINAARKTALLVCALCVVPVFLTPLADNLWISVALVSLAASAHCGFAANLFTLVSDTVPRQAVSSVVGIGGMAGAVAGMFSAQLIGRVLHCTHNNYFVPFALASLAYLVALGLMQVLVPRLEPMQLSAEAHRR